MEYMNKYPVTIFDTFLFLPQYQHIMDPSWCQDISIKRKSLMHTENDTIAYVFMNQSSTTTDDRVKLTHIFKNGQDRGSVLLDISDRKEPLVKMLQLISQQYPSRNGILVRRDKDLTFLEINFGLMEPDLDAILEKGVAFDDQSIVIPCIARKVNAVYIRLYNLPLWNRHELCSLLLHSLAKYGAVLDVGMLLEPNTDTYMGSGYAIIDTERRLYTRLNHVITDSQKKSEFYGVWEGMPDFCHCCHAKNHVFEECSKRETGVIYPEPVFETKMDEKEEYAYRNYVWFILNKDREYITVEIKTLTDKSDRHRIRKHFQVLDLKEICSKEMAMSIDNLRFIYAGKQLENDRTFADYHIVDGGIIHVVIVQRG
jgi:hypothetical protein